MSRFTQNQWDTFLQNFLSQLDSEHCQQRLALFSRLPYFFEDWLKAECAAAAETSFNLGIQLFVNEEFCGTFRRLAGMQSPVFSAQKYHELRTNRMHIVEVDI